MQAVTLSPRAGAQRSAAIVDPAPGQRRALLRSYGANLEQQEFGEDQYAAFGSAFELALAARVAGRLPEFAGRGQLLDASVHEQLQGTAQPTGVRQVLHHWALLMDQDLTGWLPLGQAQRSAAQLPVASAAAEVVDQALGSPLVRVQGQRLQFRHEWYTQFLTADALVWRCTAAQELAGELRQPHRRDLAAWAVPLHSDPGTVRDLLRELPDEEFLIGALYGRLGPVADQVALAEGRRCLEEAVTVMAASQVVCESDFMYMVVPDKSSSRYEQAVFHAVGATASDGRLLEPLAQLMRQTDEAFRRGANHGAAGYRHAVPALIAAALADGVRESSERLPACRITHAARLAWSRRSRHQPATAAKLSQWGRPWRPETSA